MPFASRSPPATANGGYAEFEQHCPVARRAARLCSGDEAGRFILHAERRAASMSYILCIEVDMDHPYSGGCACGAIRYSCAAGPAFSWNCHCRDCQRASGTAFCAVLYVPRAALSIAGQATYYEVRAESGRRVSRGFCPTCGSPLFIQADLVPDLQGLWAASLDQPARFEPQVDVWASRRQPWDAMTPTLPKIAEAPTDEEFHALLAQAMQRR